MVTVELPISGMISKMIMLGIFFLGRGNTEEDPTERKYLEVKYTERGFDVEVVGKAVDLKRKLEDMLGIVKEKIGSSFNDARVAKRISQDINKKFEKVFRSTVVLERPTNLELMEKIIMASKEHYTELDALIRESIRYGGKITISRGGVTKEIIFGKKEIAASLPDMLKQAEFQEYPQRYLKLSIHGGGTCKILLDPAWFLFLAIGALLSYSGYSNQEYHFILPASMHDFDFEEYREIPLLEKEEFIRTEHEDLYELELSWRYAKAVLELPRREYILYVIGKRGNAYILKKLIPIRMPPLVEFFKMLLTGGQRGRVERLFQRLFRYLRSELSQKAEDRIVLVFLRGLYHGVKLRSPEMIVRSWTEFLRKISAIATEKGRSSKKTKCLAILRDVREEIIIDSLRGVS